MVKVNWGDVTAAKLKESGAIQDAIAKELLNVSIEQANLYNPAIVTDVDMRGDLSIKIPGVGTTTIHENVAEGQTVGVVAAKMFTDDLVLTKDTSLLYVTDEAEIRGRANGFSPLDLQMRIAENELTKVINKKIMAALNETPQTGTSIDLSSGNIYDALAEAQGKMVNDKDVTAIICSKEAQIKIFSNVNKVAYTGSNPANPYTGMILPGANIPIFASSAVTGDYLYFLAKDNMPVLFGKREPKYRLADDIDTGATKMRIDNFTGYKSNFLKTDDGNYAAGVVKTAWT